MQNKDVEIFLKLVETRNITKTAEHLFLSQSVISTRLKKLEEELGYELFSRAKGVREMELTRQGREFVNIAVRWKNLFEEADMLRERSQFLLRIAAPESVYYDFLEDLVVPMISSHPELKLSLQINDSSGIYDMMETGAIDFGFASYESSRPNIIHSHIYDQSFCIVSYTDFSCGNSLSPLVLDPDKEVQLSGGNFSRLALWREKWFSHKQGSRIEINSPHMMVTLLREEGSWALLPEISAARIAKLYGMKIYSLTDPPESRKIYLLRHEGKEQTEAASIFLRHLSEKSEDGFIRREDVIV